MQSNETTNAAHLQESRSRRCICYTEAWNALSHCYQEHYYTVRGQFIQVTWPENGISCFKAKICDKILHVAMKKQ